jgi:hypothetical protein
MNNEFKNYGRKWTLPIFLAFATGTEQIHNLSHESRCAIWDKGWEPPDAKAEVGAILLGRNISTSAFHPLGERHCPTASNYKKKTTKNYR